MKPIRALAASVAVLAALPATAKADTIWDLVQLIGSDGAKGTSIVISNGAFGSITAFTTVGAQVFAKGFGGNLATDPEKGLGLCLGVVGQACTGDEIGEATNTAALFIDINGLAAGSSLTGFSLGSLQGVEGWDISWANTGCNADPTLCAYTAFASGFGDTDGGIADITDIAVGVTHRYWKFSPNLANCAVVNCGGHDYLLRTITVATAIPEPGTMGLLATGLIALTGAGLLRRRAKK